MKYLLPLAVLLLVGCTPTPTAPPDMPTGTAMPPPVGAVDYCKRNQTDENCRP